MSLLGWFGCYRLCRAKLRALRASEFVEAAHALGASRWRIACCHLLPGCRGVLLYCAAGAFVGAILGESALSWLGVGLPASEPSMGTMIDQSLTLPRLQAAPWQALVPSALLVAIALAATLTADGLRDELARRSG